MITRTVRCNYPGCDRRVTLPSHPGAKAIDRFVDDYGYLALCAAHRVDIDVTDRAIAEYEYATSRRR